MSSPGAKRVTLHYRRTHGDYADWELYVWQGGLCKVLRPARATQRTSFGAVFRFDLAALFPTTEGSLCVHPRRGGVADSPARQIPRALLQGDGNLFLLEGDAGVYTSPAAVEFRGIPRFLCVELPAAASGAADPWVLASCGAGVRAEFFPASPPVRACAARSACLVDRAGFFSTAVALTVCSDPWQLTTSADFAAHATWDVLSDANFLRLPRCPRAQPAFSCAPLAARDAALREAACMPGDSGARDAPGAVPPPPRVDPPRPPRPRDVLRVYYQRVGGGADGFALAVRRGGARGAAALAVPREPRLYRGAAVFRVALAAVPGARAGPQPPGALELTPVPAQQRARASEPSVAWEPALGLSVILAESHCALLRPAAADVAVLYHRFGPCADGDEWELRVRAEAHGGAAAREAAVRASFGAPPGALRFDLAGLQFARGARVSVQPVRAARRAPAAAGGAAAGGRAPAPLGRGGGSGGAARDVLRSWTAGNPPAPELHLVQGDTRVHTRAPERGALDARRFFRLRYLRFGRGGCAAWDLWTWEEEDGGGAAAGVAVAAEPARASAGRAEFVVDRARYGAGNVIRVVPRRGADAWDAKDEPMRVWRSSAHGSTRGERGGATGGCAPGGVDGERDMDTFIITEGSPHVLRSLQDLRGSLTADAERDGSIVLGASVPISWLNPRGFGESLKISDVELRASECTVRASSEQLNITPLVVESMHAISPTEIRLELKSSCLTNEDYAVEHIQVTVPGFDSVSLRWRHYEDHDKYLYPGQLGLTYGPEVSVFRCFAPAADLVSVVLYEKATGDKGRCVFPMRRIPDGCWKLILKRNFSGKYYKLLAEGRDKLLFPGVEVIDPYSRCNTSHVGRGLIYGTENTVVADRPNISVAETIVYELHLRDATIDACSGVEQRGKYLGLAERGTQINRKQVQGNGTAVEPRGGGDVLLEKLSTCLEHIVQMGVTAVQLMPVQDFDNDETDDMAYRWGYMPVHFNSPDGWYASSVTTSARITELKVLVDALHRAGLKVIMDVVYNHTAEDKNEKNMEARFSFNGLAPRYYYRTCGNTPVAHSGDSTCGQQQPGMPTCGACYSNGSGCGNEFRSEAPMGRKFIIDSLRYWAEEYKIDGFRFDLLGLIDLETITQASNALHSIDPNIVVYGEPWAGGLTPIQMTDKGSQRGKGFAVFNNNFRDAIRGSPFGAEETFVMDGGRIDEVKRGIIGSIDDFCDSPFETVNYVECHDNYTLWDHMKFYIKERQDNIVYTDTDLRRIHALCAVIVFTAQGIPFMQIGQEMCRSKFGVENSYESPDDINMVRWETKLAEWKTVQYYHGLIQLRRAHPEMFALGSAAAIRRSIAFYEDLGLSVPDRCIAFRIEGNPAQLLERLTRERPEVHAEDLKEESEQWTALVVLLNPTPEQVAFPLPEPEVNAVWMQIVDENFSGMRKIHGPLVGCVTVPGRAAAVLRKASEFEKEMSQVQLRLACISDAYAVPGGDDGLTAYAVSLRRVRSAGELRTHLALLAARKEFENTTTAEVKN